MPPNQNPEQSARDRIDEMLAECGWIVQDKKAINFNAGPGIAVREYLGPVTRVLNEREALIGVSICGIMDNPQTLTNPEVLERAAAVVKFTNAVMARALGINRAARTTCVKPEGTSSLLLGSASGIEPHHAARYFRRVTANRGEPVYRWFKTHNANMVEPKLSHATDDYIVFPVEAPTTAMLREQVTALDMLRYIKLVQKHWVQAGRAYITYADLHHNVSNTVYVKDAEWAQVAEFIWENQDAFTGVTMVPFIVDKKYSQPPRESVTTDDQVLRWNNLGYVSVDYRKIPDQLDESTGEEHRGTGTACAGGQCILAA
jgi:ribonucleoside-diphosphate reductase alpha chain